MSAPLLVFDLDGTLVDTAADLIGALNRVLTGEGLGAVKIENAGALIGAGARAMLTRGFRMNGREPDAADLDRLFPVFLALYAADLVTESRPYPGVTAMLARFAAAGWRFAICTNKPEALSVRMIEALGLSAHFAAICGGDTFAVRKPDGAHVLGTIARAGGDAARAIMIGDSLNDVAAARAAGIPVIGVSWGYTDAPVASYQPDAVIDDFADLWDAVAALGAAASAAEG
ncbi:phosphoglycolate phosphatase [Siculibacillus lacustris]|uniref:Phosphoglycolate phosphatase n=1 Tax=Siculibacillus lacustris TaxID=1549641 RepID=A0A4Q9VY56_9HYPH|nr:phosphoglycolate phosphatase [Siculibacillus lacustris]TBW40905.1 phosphoglycolate phosphatase [Siculibacillus lacustris]